ncbi:MAG: Rab family GTPase [Candidatus Hodarchaeota archaeon]
MSSCDYVFKIILFNDNYKGKQSFSRRYFHSVFNPSERLTIGVDFHVKTIELDGRSIKFQIWSFGGEERFRFLLPTYCLGARGAILLYDITDPNSLGILSEYIQIIRQKVGTIPIMLIGTKVNLGGNRKVSREEGVSIAENFNLSAFTEILSQDEQKVYYTFQTLAEIIFGESPSYVISTPKPKEYIVNQYLKLKLENNKTNIYVKERLFRQCKYLLLNISKDKINTYDEIESIDEAAEKLDSSMEQGRFHKYSIPPETEFWGHCSNIQAWYENDYATNLLHRNLAFPLLKALVEAGDSLARKVFKEEIARRFESGYPSVVLYLIKEGYLEYLNQEELESILKKSEFFYNLPNLFFDIDVPEWVREKVFDIICDLGCPCCGANFIDVSFNKESIRCRYCKTDYFDKESL